MKTRPPLKALRTFEAAARLLNFRQASIELNVTASAVSHQIRLLEDFLGESLFVRQDRKVTLTPTGHGYYRDVTHALEIIDKATDQILQSTHSDILKISAAPIFVTRWLMPRLHRFYEHYPNAELNIHPTSQQVNPASNDVDLLIRYTAKSHSERQTVELELFPVHLAPVCNLKLLTEWQTTGKFPAGTVLMEDLMNSGHRWQDWFDQFRGGEDFESMPIIAYEGQSQVFEPTIAGHGIALVMEEMAEQDFRNKVLHRLFPDQRMKSPHRMLAIFNTHNRRLYLIRNFLNWLQKECQH